MQVPRDWVCLKKAPNLYVYYKQKADAAVLHRLFAF